MTSQNADGATEQERQKVSTYKPSSFQVTQFEALTEVPPVEQFRMAEWQLIEGGAKTIDPMFEVYDDLVAESSVSESEEADNSPEGDSPPSQEWDLGEEQDPRVRELMDELREAQRQRAELEAEHERQIEALKVSVADDSRAEATRDSDEKLKAIEERYATLIEDMNAQIREGLEGVERRAVEFAVQVAKKLVGTIVEINPEYVLEVIKEGVKLTGGATVKSIRVSPQDLEFLKMLAPEKQFKEFDGSWSFQGDETIRAGCIIETSSGEVEFDLDKAWERIKESVTKVR